ncbi:MAG: hypothetical protein ABIH48_02800 [Candidatus Falkowbacteria bacterium]
MSSLFVNKVEFRHQSTHPGDFILNSKSGIDSIKFGDKYFERGKFYSDTTRTHYGWPLIYFYKQEFLTENRNGNLYLIDNFRLIIDIVFYYSLILFISVLFVSIKKRKINLLIIK